MIMRGALQVESKKEITLIIFGCSRFQYTQSQNLNSKEEGEVGHSLARGYGH